MLKLFSRVGFLAGALTVLAACAGDPMSPSRSPSDPSNPHAAEAALVTPAPIASTDAPPPAQSTPAHAHEGPADADAGTTYTCPMHPEVQSSTPGRCPKCGMTLVPKKP